MLNDVKHVVAASECSSLVQAPADSGGALGGVQGDTALEENQAVPGQPPARSF